MPDEKVNLKIPGIVDEKLVRRGDHTELYQGVQEQFRRRVAIKIHTADGMKDEALEQFQRECAVMGDLSNHPYIVTYFKSGIRKRSPYVVSEWLDDGTLADRLAGGDALDWRTAVDIGVKLAGALETAHRAGILHRKIKPQDVFQSPFGEPLIGDFRLDTTDESRSGDPYDALLHAAPELAKEGARTEDARTDVYALASVIFTLIRGRAPFLEADDEPLVRVKGRALTATPPPLPDVPGVVQTVLGWALRPDPDQRPQTAQAFGRALQAAQTATGEPQSRLQIRPRTVEDRGLPEPSIPAAAFLAGTPTAPAAAPPPAAPPPAPAAAPPPPAAAPPLPEAPPPAPAAAPPAPPAATEPGAAPPPGSFAPPSAPAVTNLPPPPGAPPPPAAPAPPPPAAPAPPPPAAPAPPPPADPPAPPPVVPAPEAAPVPAPAPAPAAPVDARPSSPHPTPEAPVPVAPAADAAPVVPAAAPAAVEAAAAFSPGSLIEDVRNLINQAMQAYVGTPQLEKIEAIEARLEEPLRVAIAGKVKAGKSTLLNGLVGEELAPTDAGECTKVVTWYTDGITYRATLHGRDGTEMPTAFSRESGALDIDLSGKDAESIERIVIEWPSSALGEMSLIDTPGIASISTDVSARTTRFLTASDDDDGQADAVIYLMRHFHPTDVRFLESFHDDELARPNPINAIGVLSRADELSGNTADAMETATRVAARYRDDPQIRRLCQTVVPVAGLLAQAGPSLRQSEYNLLERLAQLDDRELEVLLASVDRFTDGDLVGNVTSIDREALLRRLGLYGVTLSIGLIRSGEVDGSPALAKALVEKSGLVELRETLMSQFAARRDVLKARAALHAIEQMVRNDPPPGEAAGPLMFDAERIRTGAHVFSEIQLFSSHRSGAVDFRADDVDEVERLLGVQGFTPTSRLGLDPAATTDEIRTALIDKARKWKTRAESPMSDRDQQEAARVLVRTCEGMLVGLH